MTDRRHIVLIGMMGAGKTTTGRLLADRLRWPYLDTDDEIERQAGRSVPDIWRESGEAAFRKEETRVLADACVSSQSSVIAVGGGAVLDPANRDVIRRHALTVWLRADVSTLALRVGTGNGRPLLHGGPASALSRLVSERGTIYAEMAQLAFDVDRMSPPQVVDRILQALEKADPVR